MSHDRAEIVLRVDNFQCLDNLVVQLCKFYPDAAVFEGSDQPTQYGTGGDIDGRHAGKIEDDGPDPRRSAIDQIDDLPADMLRIEVEPCARAAHDKRTRRIARIRISSATDEVPGGPFASNDHDHRSRRLRDQHHQRTHRGKEKSVEQPEKTKLRRRPP